jgi:ABC-2 type transport system permease protein
MFFILVKQDMKSFFRDVRSMILVFVMPILCILLFSTVLGPKLMENGLIKPFSVAIVDEENSMYTKVLIRQLKEIELFQSIDRVSEQAAMARLANEEVAAVIVLPVDFTKSIAVGKNNQARVIGAKNKTLESQIVKSLVQSAANVVTASQSYINTVDAFEEKVGITKEDRRRHVVNGMIASMDEAMGRKSFFSWDESAKKLKFSALQYYFSSLLVMFLMLFGAPTMRYFITEQRNQLTKRFKSCQTDLGLLWFSKGCSSFLISSFCVLSTTTIGKFVFNEAWTFSFVHFVGMMMSIIIATTGWSMGVAAISSTEGGFSLLGSSLALLSAVIGGGIYPLWTMGNGMDQFGILTINHIAIEGCLQLFSGSMNDHYWTVFGSLLFIGVSFAVASYGIMKWREVRRVL